MVLCVLKDGFEVWFVIIVWVKVVVCVVGYSLNVYGVVLCIGCMYILIVILLLEMQVYLVDFVKVLLIEGMIMVVWQVGYMLLIYFVGLDDDQLVVLCYLYLLGGIDGVIIIWIVVQDLWLVFLVECDLFYVIFGCSDRLFDYVYVDIDNEVMVYYVISFLLVCGYWCIGL